jgi:16S rRNA (uracil1498-N3)-methyltransferase
MRQFLLPVDWIKKSEGRGEKVRISGEDAHYLKNVLRKKPGDTFPGLDREGNRYTLRILDFQANEVLLGLQEENHRKPHLTDFPDSSVTEIILLQCLPKGKKMDLIVRQATELGVTRILPVISRHAIPKLENMDSAKKQDRWRTIIKEAVQQSGTPRMPILSTFFSLPEAVEEMAHTADLGIFFHQEPLENGSLHGYLSLQPKKIALLIGPEGGLEEGEISLLLNRGFHPVYAGQSILRTETAAVSALAMVKILLLEKELWKMF